MSDRDEEYLKLGKAFYRANRELAVELVDLDADEKRKRLIETGIALKEERRVHLLREAARSPATASSTDVTFESLPDPFELPSMEWDAVGLLSRDTYGLLPAGPMKSLKSYLSLGTVVGTAVGKSVLGYWRVPEPRRWLLFVGEGGRALFLKRLKRWCDFYGVSVNDVRDQLRYSFVTAPVNTPQFTEPYQKELADFEPHAVHLDPWYPYAPRGLDSRMLSDVGAALDDLRSITPTPLWIAHHFNQSGNGRHLQRASGAGISEWADSWVLVEHRRTPRADVPNGNFYLVLDVGSRQWGGASYDVDLSVGALDPETGDFAGDITAKVRLAADVGTADDHEDYAVNQLIEPLLRAIQEAPNDKKLSENKIAKALGVSRAVLKPVIEEALKQQLVTRTPEPPRQGVTTDHNLSPVGEARLATSSVTSDPLEGL